MPNEAGRPGAGWDTIRVLVAGYWGESGNLIDRFYFTGDTPFFVLSRQGRRKRPMTAVVRIEEERLYFTGPRLVRWLGAGNEPQPVTGPAATEQAKSLLAVARELRAPRCAAADRSTRPNRGSRRSAPGRHSTRDTRHASRPPGGASRLASR